MSERGSKSRRAWELSLLSLPFVAHGLGAWIAERAEPGLSRRFALSLLIAAVSAALVWRNRQRFQRPTTMLAAALCALLCATLLDRGMYGVHRWLSIGPLRLHVSAIVAPWILAAAASVFRDRSRSPWPMAALVASASVAHVAQPDFGQALAFSVAMIVLLVRAMVAWSVRLSLSFALIASAAFAQARTPTLPSVLQVESIVSAARLQGAFAWIAAWTAAIAWVALLALAPRRARPLCFSFAAYAATAWLLAVRTEQYPVPLLGAGAGHVLGAYAMAWLALGEGSSHASDDPTAQQRSEER